MLALQSGAPGIGHIEAIIVVIAILAMIFWRDVIKILLMVALLLFIILVTYRCSSRHRCPTTRD